MFAAFVYFMEEMIRSACKVASAQDIIQGHRRWGFGVQGFGSEINYTVPELHSGASTKQVPSSPVRREIGEETHVQNPWKHREAPSTPEQNKRPRCRTLKPVFPPVHLTEQPLDFLTI